MLVEIVGAARVWYAEMQKPDTTPGQGNPVEIKKLCWRGKNRFNPVLQRRNHAGSWQEFCVSTHGSAPAD